MQFNKFAGIFCVAISSLHAGSVSAAVPDVAVDIAPLHSLVAQVMDGVGEPSLIIPAEASPHSYSLKPSQAKALADAEVVFWIGEELSPWLEKSISNVADSAKKVEMLSLSATTTYEFREGATFEEHGHHDEEGHDDHHTEHGDHHGEHDEHADHGHEEGLFDQLLAFFGSDEEHSHHGEQKHHDDLEDMHHHDHSGVDPHAWLDPVNAKVWIAKIEETLSKQDPENAAKYQSNAKGAVAALDSLIADTQSKVSELGELKFIVFHDAYQYFEKRFGISATGSISLSDAEDPSPARVAEIRDTVAKLGVKCVYAEPQFNAGLIDSVFEGSEVSTVGIMDPLGARLEEGKDHYTALINGMVNSLSQCASS